MDSPAVLYALRWLIHDTFRQTFTSRVFWILLSLSGLCVVFCLGVSVEGGAVRAENELVGKDGKLLAESRESPGRLNLLFGAFPIEFTRSADAEVQFLLNVFGSMIAGFAGVLMALVWTAGFMPESLHPSAASVMLAKPIPRWLLLMGKFCGVVCFIALHAAIFFAGTWFALGLRTNAWSHPEYLLGIPLLTFHFAVVYSFSVMLAVISRSTMACVVGGVLFWIACYAVNYGRHFAVVYGDLNPGAEALPGFTVFLSEAGYWLLPKPVDFTMMLEKSLNLSAGMVTLTSQQPFARVIEKDLFHPFLSICTSCVFPIFSIWASASHLSKTDY